MRGAIWSVALTLLVTTGAWAEPPTTSCGRKGQPDCPMQAWMKGKLQSNLRTNDTERLAAALHQLAELAPKGYVGWSEAALSGARAAEANDMAGVRASCKSCHDDLRTRYRNELRELPLP